MEGPLRPPSDPNFRLIETFRWEPGEGVLRHARHLRRLYRSAEQLNIAPLGVENALSNISAQTALRVRLTVDVGGQVEVTTHPYVALPVGNVWRLAVSGTGLKGDDPWLRLKTTNRAVYDTARAALPLDVDEIIFLNERDEVCEGSITNIFVRIDGRLLTPPLGCGVLPGVLREELLETGEAAEEVLTLEDLQMAEAVFVGNSLRGLIPCVLI